MQSKYKKEKKKEITEGKIYSPSGKFAERAKKQDESACTYLQHFRRIKKTLKCVFLKEKAF